MNSNFIGINFIDIPLDCKFIHADLDGAVIGDIFESANGKTKIIYLENRFKIYSNNSDDYVPAFTIFKNTDKLKRECLKVETHFGSVEINPSNKTAGEKAIKQQQEERDWKNASPYDK